MGRMGSGTHRQFSCRTSADALGRDSAIQEPLRNDSLRQRTRNAPPGTAHAHRAHPRHRPAFHARDAVPLGRRRREELTPRASSERFSGPLSGSCLLFAFPISSFCFLVSISPCSSEHYFRQYLSAPNEGDSLFTFAVVLGIRSGGHSRFLRPVVFPWSRGLLAGSPMSLAFVRS